MCSAPSKRGHTTQIAIPQAHPQVLERFVAAVGVGKVFGPYRARKKNWSTRWQVRIYGKDARAAIASLLPYLSDVKQRQAKRAVSCGTEA
jgi:hypothetical protein